MILAFTLLQMNTENDDYCTPKQTKRLGLRHKSIAIKNNSTDVATGSSAKIKRLVHSDVKINYKHIEHSSPNKISVHNETSPSTPSTSCRPYVLALSKRVRKSMTQKRLEFCMANEMEKSKRNEKLEDRKERNDITRNMVSSRKELLLQIEIARKELAGRQDHLNKVEELKHLITIWKRGFSSALQDLQQNLEPRLEETELLRQLHIPHEMIKYIN